MKYKNEKTPDELLLELKRKDWKSVGFDDLKEYYEARNNATGRGGASLKEVAREIFGGKLVECCEGKMTVSELMNTPAVLDDSTRGHVVTVKETVEIAGSHLNDCRLFAPASECTFELAPFYLPGKEELGKFLPSFYITADDFYETARGDFALNFPEAVAERARFADEGGEHPDLWDAVDVAIERGTARLCVNEYDDGTVDLDYVCSGDEYLRDELVPVELTPTEQELLNNAYREHEAQLGAER